MYDELKPPDQLKPKQNRKLPDHSSLIRCREKTTENKSPSTTVAPPLSDLTGHS